MTLEEKAGLMVSPTLPMGPDGTVNEESRPMPNPIGGPAWSLPGTSEAILKLHIRQFINRVNTPARTMAMWLNGVQEIAERSLLGSIDQFSDSTDLRSYISWRPLLRRLYAA
jgi:hypothetical protein